jgi:hypothetical protein
MKNIIELVFEFFCSSGGALDSIIIGVLDFLDARYGANEKSVIRS